MINKDLLLKVKALAESGIGGEKETAQKTLERLLKKYDISIDDLDENTIESFEFEYHGSEEEQILMQVAYKVTNSKENVYYMRYDNSGRRCRTRYSIQCTEAQKIEIEFLFDFYKELFNYEKKMLMSAFIQKHRIFGECKAPNQKELTPEEYEKLMAVMKSLDDKSPVLRITEG